MEMLKQNAKATGGNKMENQPEKKFRVGAISATIWNNSGVNQKGEVNEYKTISFERSYKDKEGEWKKTNQLRLTDIPKAVLVLNKAYEHISLTEPAAA